MAGVHLHQSLLQLHPICGDLLLFLVLLDCADLANFPDNLLDAGVADKQHA